MLLAGLAVVLPSWAAASSTVNCVAGEHDVRIAVGIHDGQWSVGNVELYSPAGETLLAYAATDLAEAMIDLDEETASIRGRELSDGGRPFELWFARGEGGVSWQSIEEKLVCDWTH